MNKIKERNKAIELRKLGKSYSEIRSQVPVSKSTLSLWLRSVGLAQRHIRRLSEKQRATQKRAVEVWHQMRIEKTKLIKEKAKNEIKELTRKERWLIGIALYWAEGNKERGQNGTRIIFSNSDPNMILYFREWLHDFLDVTPEDITYTLYIHQKSENIASAIKFWTDLLEIDLHAIKICLKKHNPSPKRKNIGVHYVGLMRLSIRKSTDLTRKIAGWIDGIISKTNIIGE